VSTGSPVVAPVTITPSDRKNSAAFAVSCKLMSDVMAWALKIRSLLLLLKMIKKGKAVPVMGHEGP
jgi:hypothetical protein